MRIAQEWLNGLAVAKGRQQVGPSVQVTIAASTLLGLDDQPGELAGHGPVPSALARALAADPTGTWRRLITDDEGTLIDYGRRRYRPTKPLEQFVRARDRECQFPGCHRGATRCEIDHRVAWADGGPTNADNLICLCTRHHHAKHEGGWTVARLDDGTLRWTSPSGRVYDNDPARYPVGVIPDRQHRDTSDEAARRLTSVDRVTTHESDVCRYIITNSLSEVGISPGVRIASSHSHVRERFQSVASNNSRLTHPARQPARRRGRGRRAR